MLAHHAEHLGVDDEEAQELPHEIRPHEFRELRRHRRVVALFERFS